MTLMGSIYLRPTAGRPRLLCVRTDAGGAAAERSVLGRASRTVRQGLRGWSTSVGVPRGGCSPPMTRRRALSPRPRPTSG